MTRIVHELPEIQAPQKKPMKHRRLKFVLFGFLFLVIAAITALVVFYVTAPTRYTILLIGSDQRGTERARSDVMILLSIPKAAPGNIVLLTIPRDSEVNDPEYGLQKMTHFYAFGDRDQGSELGNISLTKSVIERELGIHIQATAEVTFASFENLIDQIGGVTISSGQLDGEAALALVRDRYRAGGDFARTSDQREIVQALIQHLSSFNFSNQIYNYLTTNQQTSLTYKKWGVFHFAIAFALGHWNSWHLPPVHEEVLPGADASVYTPEYGKNLYYYVLDKQATKALIQKTLN